MDCIGTLQMMVCLDEPEPKEPQIDEELEDLYEIAFTQGWASAAKMAILNSGSVFCCPRDAVEVLFDELAAGEDGESFVNCMLDIVFGCDEEDDCDPNRYRKSAWDEDTLALGARGEDAACRCLSNKGYEILERNWRCDFGEADIIAKDPNGTIVFVEVKTRRSANAGVPEEAVSSAKRRRYEAIALEYMSDSDWDDCTPIRFDAVCISVKSDSRAMLRHHMGFFDACH